MAKHRWANRFTPGSRAGFNPRLLTIERGVPVSSVIPELTIPAGEAWEARAIKIAPGWFVLANSVVGGTEEDPGVAAFVWVRTEDVLDLILRRTQIEGPGRPEFEEPDPKIIGFTPLTYEMALRHEKEHGRRPMRTASYTITDGAFLYSKLDGDHREYVFAAANPEDDDKAIAVMFRLNVAT